MDQVLANLWIEALSIWGKGGSFMWALFVIAVVMFAMGVSVHLDLLRKGHRSVPERVWRRWIDRPRERAGQIGELLDITLAGESLKDTVEAFRQVRHAEMAPFERDLKVMKVCVGAAPLVGLLGTVTGMLTTFGALSSGSGGDETMAVIAAGISEALITTMTGLVIALPGLFYHHQLVRMHARYEAFIAHVETVCTQTRFHRMRERREERARRTAMSRVAAALQKAVS